MMRCARRSWSRSPVSPLTGSDLLLGHDAAVDELVAIGAIRRVAGAVVFTHPLLRTTALDLAKSELIEQIAGEVLDRLESAGAGAAADAATLVRLSAAASARKRPSSPARRGRLRRVERSRLVVCRG